MVRKNLDPDPQSDLRLDPDPDPYINEYEPETLLLTDFFNNLIMLINSVLV